MTAPFDISTMNCGSVVLINLHSPAAREWVDANVGVADWAWMGLGFACEPRLVEGLLDGARDEGLTIEGDDIAPEPEFENSPSDWAELAADAHYYRALVL